MSTEARDKKIKRVVQNRQKDLVVVFEDIHDPHNAEAALRSCDAFGVQEAYFIFENQAYFDPTEVGKTTSSSANKWLDFRVFTSTRECLDHLKQKGFQIVATVLDEQAEDIFNSDLASDQLALMLGNEHAGLSSEALRGADKHVYIPMRGMIQSFNLSVSAGIFLFEITRQRSRSSSDFSLSSQEQKRLEQEFKKR